MMICSLLEMYKEMLLEDRDSLVEVHVGLNFSSVAIRSFRLIALAIIALANLVRTSSTGITCIWMTGE